MTAAVDHPPREAGGGGGGGRSCVRAGGFSRRRGQPEPEPASTPATRMAHDARRALAISIDGC